MKNATAYAKKLRGLLRRTKVDVPVESRHTDPLDQLVYAFLLWETTHRQADQAYNRLMKHVVDHNDLRVSDPADIALAIGPRYSRIDERAVRMRDALHGVYLANHAMTLEPLNDMSKRDARVFLDSLDGMVPFVSASIVLYALGGHAIPVDQQLVAKLKRDQIADPDATLEEIQAFLEHQIKAAETLKATAELRTYAESSGGTTKTTRAAGDSRRTTKKSTKKTTKNKTTKRSTKKTTRSR